MGLILTITQLGFNEIQTSYSKAFEYSKKLEILNKELDHQVKKRTKIIQDNYENQIESIYSTSVIGSITKPLLHDIVNPISALQGTIELMKSSDKKDEQLIELAQQSSLQLYSILAESRDLMRGNNIIDNFEVNQHINQCIKMLQSELNKAKIKVQFENLNEYKLIGVKTLFDRIIINILVNAIEELRNIDNKDREILIRVNNKRRKLIIEITDNGNGISKKDLLHIFDSDFSLKSTSYNLGLGLPFVKKIIEEKFNGEVKIISEINSFTSVILTFEI